MRYSVLAINGERIEKSPDKVMTLMVGGLLRNVSEDSKFVVGSLG